MDKQQFVAFIEQAWQNEPLPGEDIKKIVDSYPFCQSAQMLYFISLYRNNDIQYHQRLKLIAAYAGNRALLKEWLGRLRTEPAEKPAEKPKADKVDVIEKAAAEPDSVGQIESLPQVKIRNEVPQQQGIPDMVKQEASKEAEVPKSRADEAGLPETHKPLSATSKSKAELIDKFIKNAPRITRSKSDFYKANDYSQKSDIDREDIVSETLARIILEQGNYEKAIKIYEKLILKVPEKSSYFARQIEKIKHKQNLNN